jgi:hypothetical protein
VAGPCQSLNRATEPSSNVKREAENVFEDWGYWRSSVHICRRRSADGSADAGLGSWWLACSRGGRTPLFTTASTGLCRRRVCGRWARRHVCDGELLGGEAIGGARRRLVLGPYRRCRQRPPAELGVPDGVGVKLTVTRCSVSRRMSRPVRVWRRGSMAATRRCGGYGSRSRRSGRCRRAGATRCRWTTSTAARYGGCGAAVDHG